jgi:hypothetical protein
MVTKGQVVKSKFHVPFWSGEKTISKRDTLWRRGLTQAFTEEEEQGRWGGAEGAHVKERQAQMCEGHGIWTTVSSSCIEGRVKKQAGEDVHKQGLHTMYSQELE